MEGESPDSAPKMTGRVIIVTGANSGIGFEASKFLCDEGNEVILACRNEEKGKAAVGKILKANPNALASFMQLDLADLASVRQFAEDFHQSRRKLHVLVNNAGIYLWEKDPKRYFTKDNFELTMGTNHLGHFLLTHLLLDDLKKTGAETGDARIVVVTSILHDGSFRNKNLPAMDVEDFFLNGPGKYNANLAYKNSKLANLLFTYELVKKLEGTGVTINALCPGFIPSTELVRHASTRVKLFTRYVLDGILRFTKVTRTTAQGGRAITELATDEKMKGITGKFYRDHAEVESSAESRNEELAKTVWDLSARYCHLEGYEPLDAPPPPVEEPKPETPAKDKKKGKKVEAEVKVEGEGETVIKTEGEGQAEAKAEGEGQVEVKVEAVAEPSEAKEEKKEDEKKEEEKKEEKKEEEKKEEEKKEEEKKEEKVEEINKEEADKEEKKVVEIEPEMKGKEIDPIEAEKKAVENIAGGDTSVAAN